VMHATVLAFVWMRSGFGWHGIGWPDGWPYLVQVFAAGVPLDLSVYVMHRLSHRHGLLWRLHSIHHSSNRLYWLNGERRHPLHAAIMAAPGLAVLGLLGTPAVVVGGWFAAPGSRCSPCTWPSSTPTWTTGWARSSASWAAQNFTAGTTENASRKRR